VTLDSAGESATKLIRLGGSAYVFLRDGEDLPLWARTLMHCPCADRRQSHDVCYRNTRTQERYIRERVTPSETSNTSDSVWSDDDRRYTAVIQALDDLIEAVGLKAA
jgi:hypothetical protein